MSHDLLNEFDQAYYSSAKKSVGVFWQIYATFGNDILPQNQIGII